MANFYGAGINVLGHCAGCQRAFTPGPDSGQMITLIAPHSPAEDLGPYQRVFHDVDCLKRWIADNYPESDFRRAEDALQSLYELISGLVSTKGAISGRMTRSPEGPVHDLTFTLHATPTPVTIRRVIRQSELIERHETGTMLGLAMSIVGEYKRSITHHATETAGRKSVRLFYGDNMIASFYPADDIATPTQEDLDGGS